MERRTPYEYLPERQCTKSGDFAAMRVRSFFAYTDALFATVWAKDRDCQADLIVRANNALAAGIVFG